MYPNKRKIFLNKVYSKIELFFRLAFLNRKSFEKLIYTDVYDALAEAKKRSAIGLNEQVTQKLDGDIPVPLKDGLRAVLGRHIATPNFESSRFLIIADGIELKPLFFEYLSDFFTTQNEEKRHLGKMVFVDKINKAGDIMTKHASVIDLNKFQRQKLNQITTLWGESLSEFHHNLFQINYKNHMENDFFYDASVWIKNHGFCPEKYYKDYLSLFISHGILFENFLLHNSEEKKFIRQVFLPAFIEIKNLYGYKPLIVALSPTNIEEDRFWFCYSEKIKEYVYNKITNHS